MHAQLECIDPETNLPGDRARPPRSIRVLVGLTVLALGSAGALFAQPSTGAPPSAKVEAVEEGPVLDGRLDDPVWLNAEVLADLVQREPVEGQPVSERTEVRLLYDEEALYIGAWMFVEDPSTIVVGETRRDASLDDTDAFLVVIDTYRDRQNGFVFGTTPVGIEYDGQVTRDGQGGGGGPRRQQAGSGGGFNLNWDGAWQVATSTDSEGWYAEMRLPFSTLRYLEGGDQTWGLNFARNIRSRNEQSVWARIPRQFNLYRVSLAGTVSGFQAPANKIFTITPYVLGDVSRDYSTQTSAESNGDLGGEAKIGLNQSLTLDLTVNTDFAQVEVDDQQVNLTRFPLFFPEKRAFFLENAGTFSVGSGQSADLFFSRRIGLSSGEEVPIDAGARMTGKVGGMQVGFLNIQSRHLDVFDSDSGDDVRIEPDNNFGVVRLFQEFENRTRLGGIFISRVNTDQTSDYNLTYAVDGRLGIGEAVQLDGWIAGTSTPGVDSGEYGYNFGARYDTRDWRLSATYREIGDEFNPEVGFLPRRAYRHVTTRILRAYRFPELTWFRELRPHISWSQWWNLEGFSETYMVHIDSHFEFSNGAFFQLPAFNFTGEGLVEPFEIRDGIFIPPGSYDNFDWGFRANTNQSSPLSIEGTIDAGGFFSGRRLGTSTTLTYRHRDKLLF